MRLSDHIRRSHRRSAAGLGSSVAPAACVDVLLVCSSGGHLLQLLALREAWEGYRTAWVTDDTSDAHSLLGGQQLYFVHGPVARSVRGLLRNLPLAWRILCLLRPGVVLTTGAATAVPFAWLGRLRGARVVYVESITRVDRPSLAGRLIAPVADRVYAQWPDLVPAFRKARYVGGLFGERN